MRRTAALLSAGTVGVAALVGGLGLDAHLHGRDPGLAHREGLVPLGNPGHVLVGIGIGLVVLGVVGAAYTTLPDGVGVRRGILTGALAMIVVSGDIAGWAASVERSGSTAGQPAHAHSSVAPTRQPTAAELEAATRLIVETRAAAGRYADLRAAIALGYVPMGPPDFQILHYANPRDMVDA